MAKAKILTTHDIDCVLNTIARGKHIKRNRALLLIMVLGGLCVKEAASLCYEDVVDHEGRVKSQIHLRLEQTKNQTARTVLITPSLHAELQHYVNELQVASNMTPFFYTQKREGFNSNTLTQHFFWLYKKAGIEGASSRSGQRTFRHDFLLQKNNAL